MTVARELKLAYQSSLQMLFWYMGFCPHPGLQADAHLHLHRHRQLLHLGQLTMGAAVHGSRNVGFSSSQW